MRAVPLTLVSSDVTFPKRAQKFKSDYAEFRKEFERIKEEVRDTLFSPFHLLAVSMTIPAHCGTTHRALLHEHWHLPNAWRWKTTLRRGIDIRLGAGEPFRANGSGAHAYLGASREAHALHEQDFLRGTEARLGEFLAQGREVLDSLVDQRAMLKGTQRRLRDAANTLGLSRDVVGWIERRRCAMFLLFHDDGF